MSKPRTKPITPSRRRPPGRPRPEPPTPTAREWDRRPSFRDRIITKTKEG